MRDANWQTFFCDKPYPWWRTMSRIFVGGSISIKQIPDVVKGRVANMVASGFAILVGDANGVDAAIQRFLAEQNYGNVCVYCSGKLPRNNLGSWPVRCVESGYAAGTRAFFTAKDLVMAREADYGLMIWDMESAGTLANVLELVGAGKKCVVYLQVRREFVNVGDIVACKGLVGLMTETARKRADQKIGLQKRFGALEAAQTGLF
jgi:hypothetical protein